MKLNKLMIALVVMFTCFAGKATAQGEVVAEVAGTKYTDIYAAFKYASKNSYPVTICRDLVLDRSITITNFANVPIQGNGKTIRFVGVNQGFIIQNSAEVTFAAELNIIGDGANTCPVYIKQATVTSSANISTTSGNAAAPVMTDAGYDATVTIEGGDISSEDAAAIYWPSFGTLKVTGGSISGTTAIYLKSGALAISGGDLLATGAKQTYLYVEDGYKSTGAAVVIENVGEWVSDYQEVRSVVIDGGTFTSTHAAAIESYTAGLDVDVTAKTSFVWGGTFSSDVTALLAQGYVCKESGSQYVVERNPDIAFVAQVNGVGYTSLHDAVVALKSGQELLLLEDVTLTTMEQLKVTNVTINLNHKKITANCRKAFEVYADVVIKDGTIHAMSRCIDTRSNVNLVLSDLDLKGTSPKVDGVNSDANPQPITLGGSDHGTKVTMTRVSVDFGNNCSGYAIISFVKTDLTATDCEFKNAYNVLYAKPNDASNSVFTFKDCNMYAKTPSYDPSNNFALITVVAKNVKVYIDGGYLKTDGQVRVMSFAEPGGGATGSEIAISAATTVDTEDGDLILYTSDFSENTITLPATEAYIAKLKDENFWVQENGGTVTPLKSVSFEDKDDFAYTNDTDLENMDVTYTRTFSKSGVWNAVFFPFEVALNQEFLDKYEVAEWSDVVTTVNDNKLEAWSIELTKIKDPAAVLQANRPYFILAKTDDDRAFKLDLKNVTLTAVQEDNEVKKEIAGVMTCKMVGNYKKLSGDAELGPNRWVVSASGKWIHAGSMKAFRVFMTRELASDITAESSVLNTMRVIIREPNGGTTVIEGIEAEGAQVEATYDLQGRSVVNPTKGSIYIVNGKKVIKK